MAKKRGNPYHDAKGLFASGPSSGFKSPESIARHQARLIPGSDRESTLHGEPPSETTRKRIEALEQDIKEHGDIGGTKSQRVKYMKGQHKERLAHETYVRNSWGPPASSEQKAQQAAWGQAALVAKLRKTVADSPGSMAARMAQEKLDRLK